MKKVLIGSILASGLLFAAHDKNATTNRVSAFEREALASQSPPVHVPKKNHNRKAEQNKVRVVSNSQTVNAFIPAGK